MMDIACTLSWLPICAPSVYPLSTHDFSRPSNLFSQNKTIIEKNVSGSDKTVVACFLAEGKGIVSLEGVHIFQMMVEGRE